MKRRNQIDHVIACNNKPEVTISVYDNGKKRSKWIGGIAVDVHGGESYSYDGFRARALQDQTFELLIDRMSTIFGAPSKAATKPKERGDIFDRFTSVFSEFFENGGLGVNRAKRDPDPHPESVEAARCRLNIFLAENYPSECTNGNLSATRFAEWPADIAVKVIRALRHADENMRHELKKFADFLSERYASHAKDGERTVDFAMRILTPGNGTGADVPQSKTGVRTAEPEPVVPDIVAAVSASTDSNDAIGQPSHGNGDSAIKETNSARFSVGVTLPGQHIDEPHTVPVTHDQRCDTDVKDAVKSYLRTYVRIGGKRLDLKNGLADAERCLNDVSAANLRALWPILEADAREIAALRDFVKGDIAEGEHPVAAAIRCMKSLTESNRRPVQWVRSVDGLPTDCPIGFAPDGDWQLASNDSGVVTWRRPMRTEKVHHKTIVVLRSPKGMHNGRRGKACFVGDKMIAMWLDVGNGAERVQPDGIEWGDA